MHMSVRGAFAASLLVASMVCAAPAFADEADAPKAITISANVALTTDYRFRGVSLSGGDPAIQGGITVTHESGFYASVWSSSLKSTPVNGSQELDLIAGWSGKLTSALKLDAGMLYYVYPNGHVGHANYWEPYASISTTVGPASLKLGVAYDWNQKSLGDNDNLYVYGNVDVAIPKTPLTVSGHLGYTDGVLAPNYLAGSDKKHGWDWSLGASATIYGPISLGVSYIGVTGPSINGYTDDTVVATLTATI